MTVPPLVDLGPDAQVFDPSMAPADIQARIDRVFQDHRDAQFGPVRQALLFLPGTYEVDIPLGFFTQVLGLGRLPGDTVIRGRFGSTPWLPQDNATCNFWRGFENLTVEPAGGTLLWAVAQATPVRRVHIRGSLALSLGPGWSSGGFLADSVVDGTVDSGSQQQWLTRSSRIGGWKGASWNMVFAGVEGAPGDESWPQPPHTVEDRVTRMREKPFLTATAEGWGVFVPGLRAGSRGPSWSSGDPGPGRLVPLDRFHVARPQTDGADSLNAALGAGKHLLLTPGVYRLTGALRVDRPGTLVLGLGFATLRPEAGTPALTVADVGGVILAGLLLDAPEAGSPVLMEVGPPGSSADHREDPVSLHDLFFRVGGPGVGRAAVSLRIGAGQVIGDHFWVWRADHGQGVGWDDNTAAHGLVVDGNEVTVYGLFVEHYQKDQTVWNGEDGKVVFYQSEIPYDVPDQGSWADGGREGYASYRVADTVRRHQASGLGIYCYFRSNPSLRLGDAVRTPGTPGIRLRHLTTVSLGGVGQITHVADGRGEAVRKDHPVARLKE